MNPTRAPQLRVARASRDIEAARRFYTEVLRFEVLATFDDHAGFDGVILGHDDWPYHLEFTRRRTHAVPPMMTDEDLLVFYLPDPNDWDRLVRRVRARGVQPVRSGNPWWDDHGVTIVDPDGYRIVLANGAWT